MDIIPAIVFITVTAIHLFAPLKKNKKLRNQTGSSSGREPAEL